MGSTMNQVGTAAWWQIHLAVVDLPRGPGVTIADRVAARKAAREAIAAEVAEQRRLDREERQAERRVRASRKLAQWQARQAARQARRGAPAPEPVRDVVPPPPPVQAAYARGRASPIFARSTGSGWPPGRPVTPRHRPCLPSSPPSPGLDERPAGGSELPAGGSAPTAARDLQRTVTRLRKEPPSASERRWTGPRANRTVRRTGAFYHATGRARILWMVMGSQTRPSLVAMPSSVTIWASSR